MNLMLITKRHGQQLRQKLSLKENDCISIGRCWNSDILIDDEYADPTHVTLSLNDAGKLILEEQGSQNGTRVNGQLMIDTAEIKTNSSLLIGDTTLVIHDADIPVEPAVKRSTTHSLFNRFNSFGGAISATIAVVLSLLVSIFAMSGEQGNRIKRGLI